MVDPVQEFLKRVPLPREELEWMARVADTRIIERGGVFCGIGQTRHEVGFIETGIIQVYEVSEDGEKVVQDFSFPGGIALAFAGAVKGEPSRVSIEAVTTCKMMVWPYTLSRAAQARHEAWASLHTRYVEEAYARKQERYRSLLTLAEIFTSCQVVGFMGNGLGRRVSPHVF